MSIPKIITPTEERMKETTPTTTGGRNDRSLFRWRNLWLLGVLAVLVILPFPLRSNQYLLFLMTIVLLYAVLATAWNIIGGMAGQLDLAMAGYMGLGSFTAGTLLLRWNITPWIGMFVGGLVAVALAVLIGFPLFGFKIKEVWYALSSLALVEVLRVAFLMWDEVGGPTEVYIYGQGGPLYTQRFNTYMPYYFIMLVFLVIVLYVSHRIRNSKLGYSLLALGEDEDAVEVLGVDSRSAKLKALMIYAFIGGVVGGVYASMYGYLHPAFFDTDLSTEVAILGIVGGMGITYGPLLAAILLVSFREYLRTTLGGGLEGLYLVVYAVVLILIALYRPRGIATLLQEGVERVKATIGAKRDATTADAESR